MKSMLLAFMIAGDCLALEFDNQAIKYITNSHNGVTRLYRIDCRPHATRTNSLLCTSGECVVNFAKAIELADQHVRATFPTRTGGLLEPGREGLVVECSIHRMSFSQSWLYLIRISPQENVIGRAAVLEIPVMMDGSIPTVP
jgi:hypothetical protein